jgi:hypothetical protein
MWLLACRKQRIAKELLLVGQGEGVRTVGISLLMNGCTTRCSFHVTLVTKVMWLPAGQDAFASFNPISLKTDKRLDPWNTQTSL